MLRTSGIAHPHRQTRFPEEQWAEGKTKKVAWDHRGLSHAPGGW